MYARARRGLVTAIQAVAIQPTEALVFDSSPGEPAHGEWPLKFATERPGLTVINCSQGGAEFETHTPANTGFSTFGLIDRWADWILSQKSDDPDVRSVLILAPGAHMNRLTYNSYDGVGLPYGHAFTNGASVYTAAYGIGDVIDLAHASEIEIAVCTAWYWEDPDYVRATYRAFVDQMNAAIVANTRGADWVFDLAPTTPLFDPVTNSPAYYADGFHPSVPLGSDAMGERVAAASVGAF